MSDPASCKLTLRVFSQYYSDPMSMKQFSPQSSKSGKCVAFCSMHFFYKNIDVCCKKRYYTLCLSATIRFCFFYLVFTETMVRWGKTQGTANACFLCIFVTVLLFRSNWCGMMQFFSIQ